MREQVADILAVKDTELHVMNFSNFIVTAHSGPLPFSFMSAEIVNFVTESIAWGKCSFENVKGEISQG